MMFRARIGHRQKGFTLVEMLVYLAIFFVVSTASVAFLLSLDDLIDQYRLETMLYRSGSSAMEQVLLAIRQSDQVDVVNTTEDSPNTGRLTVVTSATTTMFALNGNELDLTINGTDYGDLTGDSVTVDTFTVYYYPRSIGGFVRVRLSITATLDSGNSKSVTLYGGAVVRGDL